MLMEEVNTAITPSTGEYFGGVVIGIGLGVLVGTVVVVGIALAC
jgi:hypothetical protein